VNNLKINNKKEEYKDLLEKFPI